MLADASGSRIPLPIAFELVRRHQRTTVADLGGWLSEVLGGARLQELLDETEAQLDERRPIDLSHWVDIPSGTGARFIDATTDLVRGVTYLGLMSVDPDQPARQVRVGPSTAQQIETFRRIWSEVAENQERLASDLALRDVGERLERLTASVEQGITALRRTERDEVRASEIDPSAASAIRDALMEEWQSGYPRSMFREGGVPTLPIGRRPRTFLTTSSLELKSFFIRGRAEPSTMKMMGAHWARALLAGESRSMVEQLRMLRLKTWKRLPLDRRVQWAIEDLRRTGKNATHIIGPVDWRLLRGGFVQSQADGHDGQIGNFGDLSVYESIEVGDDDLYVLALPGAITIRQFEFPEGPFQVTVKAIDDAELARLATQDIFDVEGEEDDTPQERIRMRARVTIREGVEVQVTRSHVRRIGIPR
jgi:hypothetical protein